MSNILQLSVVIVGFQSRGVLGPCLASLDGDSSSSREILLVDNASTDGTAAWVREAHPDVKLLHSPTNVGFARACNQALQVASGRHILFLNPDTILAPATLGRMLERLESESGVGILSPRLHGGGPPAWGRFPTPLSLALGHLPGTPPPLEPPAGPVDWVLGACMLVRGDLLRRLGGFDPDYFLYGEDLDLCDRVQAAGFSVLYAPEIAVYHRGNDVWDDARRARVQSALLTFFRKRRSRTAHLLVKLGLGVLNTWRRLVPWPHTE
ncbi:MAG: glycosyltransferase family 2 protein [Candidatus Riflebacteria bacterium]|nr:glycosyltransferase family 2 protein [Candidatus Riflebacteria bacterium]